MSQIGASLIGSYDLRLVVLSIFIAISASYAALDLGGRVSAARGWARSAWLVGGAVTMGFGIWSMHFTGMLAFSLPIPVAYHWPTVLLSLLAAILASGVALYVAGRKEMDRFQAVTGGLLMGFGIAGMHYIGMAAMRMPAVCHYSPLLVTLSVLIAVIASLAALGFPFDYRENSRSTILAKVISASMMGAAISLMHYTGMMAARFFPSTILPDISHAVSVSGLGLSGIAIGTFVVQALAVLTSSVDRQLAVQAQELQTSERFRQIADFLKDVLLLSNRDLSEVLFVNRAYEAIWGRTVGSLYAAPGSWVDGVHPDDRQQVQEGLRGLVVGESLDYVECRVVRPDGSISWVRLRARPVFDSQGHPYRIVASFHEFTKRKLAEEERRQIEEQYRAVVETATDAVVSIDENSRILFANPAITKTFGYQPSEVIGQALTMLMPEVMRELHKTGLQRYLATGQRHMNWQGVELIGLRKSGEEFPLEVSFAEVVKQDHRVFTGFIRDITERKRAVQELRQSEDRIRAILDFSPNWIFLKDTEGRYLLVSKEVERVFRVSQEQIIGKTDSEIFPPERAAEYRANDLKVLRAGLTMEFEEIADLEDGLHTSIVHKFPLFDTHGNIYATGGVATDITDRKRAEEEVRQVRERIESILSSMSDTFILFDRQWRYLYLNDAAVRATDRPLKEKERHSLAPERANAVRATGGPPKEVLGRTLWELFPEVVGTELDRQFHRSMDDRVNVEFDFHFVQSGVDRWWEIRAYPQPEGLAVFATEITERKRADEQLRRLSGELLRSQDEERRRIARDLHDSMGQDLVALATMLGQLRASIPSSRRNPRRLLSECKALADKCIRDVRTLSYVLHPPVLDAAGLGDAIRDYVKGFTKRSGIQVELDLPPRRGRLARDIELVLFRVVQESLTNIQRHSGSQQAKIRVIRNSHLTLEISDVGRGLSATKQSGSDEARLEVGVGIPSMQERVKLIGGLLEIDSTSQGTRVRVTIPLERNEREKTAHSSG